MKTRYVLPAIIAIVVIGLVGFVIATVVGSTQSKESHEYRIVIPAGTGDRIAAGEDPDIVPLEIRLTIGEKDTLVIENRDTVGHTIGDFWVGTGETLRQKFHTPGVYLGLCTVHPAQQIQIIVSDKG